MVTPTKKTSSHRKKGMIYNPFSKKWVDVDSDEGKKVKRLVKNCKKCPSNEIYDHAAQKCVKRNPKNLARLREIDKFCKLYRVEKIKMKNTDKLVFGKIINAKLPGGNFKIKDVIGSTRAKVIAYELEKKNKDRLKIAAMVIPVVLTLAGLAISNPRVFNFIKEKIMEVTKGNPFFNKMFSRVLKTKPITSQEIFIPGQDNLKVKLDKNDFITKNFIEKDNLGSIDPSTNIATVNTNKLGIKGIQPYTDLSRYTIKYDPGTKRYSLISGSFGSSTVRSLSEIASTSTSTGSQDLKDIVVNYSDRKVKINQLLAKLKKTSQKIDEIQKEKELILKYENLREEHDKLKQVSIDLSEDINSKEEEKNKMLGGQIKMSNIFINDLNTKTSQLKSVNRKMSDLESDMEKIKNTNDTIFLKYKNKFSTLNDVESMVAKNIEINIISKKLNETNINALYPVLDKEIKKLENAIQKYDNLEISNMSS